MACHGSNPSVKSDLHRHLGNAEDFAEDLVQFSYKKAITGEGWRDWSFASYVHPAILATIYNGYVT